MSKKTTAERLSDIREDPKKLKRLFNIIWIAGYGMLILGFFIIVWVLYAGI